MSVERDGGGGRGRERRTDLGDSTRAVDDQSPSLAVCTSLPLT
jgi:hypothetical protein